MNSMESILCSKLSNKNRKTNYQKFSSPFISHENLSTTRKHVGLLLDSLSRAEETYASPKVTKDKKHEKVDGGATDFLRKIKLCKEKLEKIFGVHRNLREIRESRGLIRIR